MKKVLIFFLFLLFPISTFWNYEEIDSKIRNAYSKVYHKIYTKNKKDKWLSFLYKLQENLSKFYDSKSINSKNSSILADLQKLNNEKIFSLEQEKLKKQTDDFLKWNKTLLNFKQKIYNTDKFFVLEDGVWYTYFFEKYYNFSNINSINVDFIKNNWLNYKKSVIFVKDNKVSFLKEYKKHRLIRDDLLYWVPNKNYILTLLKKYSFRKNSSLNLDDEVLLIRNKTEQVTKNSLKLSEKIEKIYDYILKNTSYSTNYSFANPDFFSWIKTFKNKSWVCEWYTELFVIMLSFSLIDSKLLTWDVLDAPDFGSIWHAWVQIWDYYYDPTFDDPTGTQIDKNKEDYVFFKLPRDLFYTNRYDDWETPKHIKESDINYRRTIINAKLNWLYEKYKKYNYNIFKQLDFKKKHSINPIKKMTLDDLIKVTWDYYKTDLVSVELNWERKSLKKIKYYELKDDNDFILTFLESIDYKIDWYSVFKVNKENREFFVISNKYEFY